MWLLLVLKKVINLAELILTSDKDKWTAKIACSCSHSCASSWPSASTIINDTHSGSGSRAACPIIKGWSLVNSTILQSMCLWLSHVWLRLISIFWQSVAGIRRICVHLPDKQQKHLSPSSYYQKCYGNAIKGFRLFLFSSVAQHYVKHRCSLKGAGQMFFLCTNTAGQVYNGNIYYRCNC